MAVHCWSSQHLGLWCTVSNSLIHCGWFPFSVEGAALVKARCRPVPARGRTNCPAWVPPRLPCSVGPFSGAIFAIPFHIFFRSEWVSPAALPAACQLWLVTA